MTAAPALIAPVATPIHKTMLLPPHRGQRNPFGQRVCSGSASHCSSVPYSSRNCDNDIPRWDWMRLIGMESRLVRVYQSCPKDCSRSFPPNQVGKSGIVARKIAATFSSIGLTAMLLWILRMIHAECVHRGMIKSPFVTLLAKETLINLKMESKLRPSFNIAKYRRTHALTKK